MLSPFRRVPPPSARLHEPPYAHPGLAAVGVAGARWLPHSGLVSPMFSQVSELIELFKIRLRAGQDRQVDAFRTLESGTVEEFVVVEIAEGVKKLLFRVWPIFYTDRPRIEYRVYARDPSVENLVTDVLMLGAQARNARLVLKD